MKINRALASTALIATVIYLLFTAASLSLYPQAFSPINNWLSDLGNPNLNPDGAFYYDLGGILTSAVLFVFFASMFTWRPVDKKARILLLAAQISGVALACAFLLTAVFPLGVNDSMHSAFSILLFISVGCFEVFSASAIRRNPAFPKSLVLFGFAASIINFIFAVSFNFGDLFFGEWIMIGLFAAYMVAISLTQILKLQSPHP